eukprot:TRINITY_DN32753_c0_g2_i1.p1 TRINITY_DN32753_c0_g2~~TRINITY_DN32753_c0_g2_i1.p1  ORF type:complete len:115 (-),score=5.18 TRINITY_DN32753_c0_g2_i1:374-718(-)
MRNLLAFHKGILHHPALDNQRFAMWWISGKVTAVHPLLPKLQLSFGSGCSDVSKVSLTSFVHVGNDWGVPFDRYTLFCHRISFISSHVYIMIGVARTLYGYGELGLRAMSRNRL